jgi:hypothetical protein
MAIGVRFHAAVWAGAREGRLTTGRSAGQFSSPTPRVSTNVTVVAAGGFKVCCRGLDPVHVGELVFGGAAPI